MNLYEQVGKSFRLDVGDSFHVKGDKVKLNSDILELIGSIGVTFRCGGNTLTVNNSGIHLKTANIDTSSSYSGVNAQNVTNPTIKKPLYEKLRVVKIEANIVKQDNLIDSLEYTAIVEKYQNDAWAETTELNETQLSQLQWVFAYADHIRTASRLTSGHSAEVDSYTLPIYIRTI